MNQGLSTSTPSSPWGGLFRVLTVCVAVLGLSLSTVQGCGNGSTKSDGLSSSDASSTADSNNGGNDSNTNPPTERNTVVDNAPPPETRCFAVLECAQTKCPYPFPTDCLQKCADTTKVTGAGLTQFTTLKSCLTTNCSTCTAGDQACWEACVKVNCAKDWIACSTDGKNGTAACRETQLCETNCEAKDQTCVSGCLKAASPQALQALQDYKVCEGKKAQGTLTKQEADDCYNKDVACLCPQYNQPGQGAKTCSDSLTCVNGCNTQSCCVAKCRSEMSQPAVQPSDTFLNCVVTKCTTCQPNDQACIDKCAAEQCPQELVGCLCPGTGQPGTGSGSCNKGLECAQKCSLTDICCGATCAANMSSKAYQKFLKFAECIPKCGCKEGDNKCIEKCAGLGGKCFSEALDCSQN